MTKIEIEKPVLPDWLSEMIEKHNKIHKFLGEAKEERPRRTIEFLEYYFSDKNLEIDKREQKQLYLKENETKILTALIYGYDVED